MKVFFLGAGASIPEGAPATDEILSLVLKEGRNNERVIRLKRFLGRHFPGFDPQVGSLPTFEEVLTLVDMAIRRQEGLSQSFDVESLQQIREDLLYALCWILDKRLPDRGRLHRRFLNELHSREMLGRDSVSFLTTNYDILLDNALLKYGEIDVDYFVHFRNTGKDWHMPRVGRGVRVLKLHGSLNWLLCTVCNTVKITPRKKGVMQIWTDFSVCGNDKTRQRPIIIPPSHQKAMESPHLSRIWLEAEQVLRRARELFFVGYSLSEADSHIRYLLKRGIHGPWRDSDKRPPIHVIGRESSGDTSAVKARYMRLFGDIDWQPVGFQGFVDRAEDFL